MREDDPPRDPADLPPELRPPEPRVLSANQLVSYNLMRARRTHAWTQQDVADLLQRYTGRSWSNASVSAAERAWQGGRPRRFDASEIVAFSKIFDEPLAYFFIPPEGEYLAKWVGMQEFPNGQPNMNPSDSRNDLMALVPTADLVVMAGISHKAPADFVARMQELSVQWLGLVWNRPEWRHAMREIRSMDELWEEQRTGGVDWAEVAGEQPAVQLESPDAEGVLNITVTPEELKRTVENLMEDLTRETLRRLMSGEAAARAESSDDQENE